MRAAIFNGPHKIVVGDRPDPVITAPTDVIVGVTLGCVCGSDLWYYRGESPHALGPIGHEFIGVVTDVGSAVTGFAEGDLVVAPFVYNDGTCPHCLAGWPSNCANGGSFGNHGVDGGQGEAVRVPFADATLVKVPGSGHDDATMRSLVALSDVMCTGHHAAVSGGVKPGMTVAVVGDGAVGLCATIAAKRLGAERILLMGRHEARTNLGREFGATDVIVQRGEEGVARLRELTGGDGTPYVLECVGTKPAIVTAFGVARDGGVVSRVGAPQYPEVPMDFGVFMRNITLTGGVAPARAYIEELMPDILNGTIQPGRVFDRTVTLDGVPDGYRAMADREALKVLVRA